jgi:hypothetical protein
VNHLFGPWAFQPVTQWAVWINILVAHDALICITDGIQSTTATLDGAAHKDDADRHAQHDEHQQRERKQKGNHDQSP